MRTPRFAAIELRTRWGSFSRRAFLIEYLGKGNVTDRIKQKKGDQNSGRQPWEKSCLLIFKPFIVNADIVNSFCNERDPALPIKDSRDCASSLTDMGAQVRFSWKVRYHLQCASPQTGMNPDLVGGISTLASQKRTLYVSSSGPKSESGGQA